MPNKGDEFHHFGWNACSSALSPLTGHAFLERRYLIIPGMRSSRIYVVDTKPDPTQAKIHKIIEPEEVFRKTGYSRPHTDPLRAGGHLRLARSAAAARTAPTARPASSSWTARRSRSSAAGRSTAARRTSTMISGGTCRATTWCRANGRCRRNSRTASCRRTCSPTNTAISIHFWDLRARRNVQTIDLGANHQMALEVRPAHDPVKRVRLSRRRRRHHQSRRLDLDVVARGRQVPLREDRDHSARAGDEGQTAAAAAGFRRRAAAGHRHRPVAGRPLPLRRPAGAPARCASTTSPTR